MRGLPALFLGLAVLTCYVNIFAEVAADSSQGDGYHYDNAASSASSGSYSTSNAEETESNGVVKGLNVKSSKKVGFSASSAFQNQQSFHSSGSFNGHVSPNSLVGTGASAGAFASTSSGANAGFNLGLNAGSNSGLNGAASAAGSGAINGQSGSQYWWMNAGSPFAQAGCNNIACSVSGGLNNAAGGAVSGSHSGSFNGGSSNTAGNPFLNGAFSNQANANTGTSATANAGANGANTGFNTQNSFNSQAEQNENGNAESAGQDKFNAGITIGGHGQSGFGIGAQVGGHGGYGAGPLGSHSFGPHGQVSTGNGAQGGNHGILGVPSGHGGLFGGNIGGGVNGGASGQSSAQGGFSLNGNVGHGGQANTGAGVGAVTNTQDDSHFVSHNGLGGHFGGHHSGHGGIHAGLHHQGGSHSQGSSHGQLGVGSQGGVNGQGSHQGGTNVGFGGSLVGQAGGSAGANANAGSSSNVQSGGYPVLPKPNPPFVTGFVNCKGVGRVCVSKAQCVNGFATLPGASQINQQNQRCNAATEVCCTVKPEEPVGNKPGESEGAESNGYLPPIGSSPSHDSFDYVLPPKQEDEQKEPEGSGASNQGTLALPPAAPVVYQLGCAAALKCVEEKYCTMIGTISDTPLSLTDDQKLRSVPMVDCKNPDNGVLGKCCRDPNYVDPWPAGNLPANYSGGFDEQGFPTFLNISKTKKPIKPISRQPSIPTQPLKPQPSSTFPIQFGEPIRPQPQPPKVVTGQTFPPQSIQPQPTQSIPSPPVQPGFSDQKIDLPPQNILPSFPNQPAFQRPPQFPTPGNQQSQPQPPNFKGSFIQPASAFPNKPTTNTPQSQPQPPQQFNNFPSQPAPSFPRPQPPANQPPKGFPSQQTPNFPQPQPPVKFPAPTFPQQKPQPPNNFQQTSTFPSTPALEFPQPQAPKDFSTPTFPQIQPQPPKGFPAPVFPQPKPQPPKDFPTPVFPQPKPQPPKGSPPSTGLTNQPGLTFPQPPQQTQPPFKNFISPPTSAFPQQPSSGQSSIDSQVLLGEPQPYPGQPKTSIKPQQPNYPSEDEDLEPYPSVVKTPQFGDVLQPRPFQQPQPQVNGPIKISAPVAGSQNFGSQIKTFEYQHNNEIFRPQEFSGLPSYGKGYEGASTNQNSVSIPLHTPGAQCGIINAVPNPLKTSDVDVGFGAIPWQAMILSNAEKKLLCSGAVVAPNVVLTAAHCVYGLNPSELSIKVGEWKLGYELKHEEPLPFEIVQVQSIFSHPKYQPDAAGYDTALLFLEKPVKLDLHVDTICIPQNFVVPHQRNCISVGWGKVILQTHAAGALMHKIDVDVLTNDQCTKRIQDAESQVDLDDSLVCAKAQKQNNNMCQVDVGGPLACDRGDGIYELVGVYSQDTGCQPINQVATFALVDNKWVNSMINGGTLQQQINIISGSTEQSKGSQTPSHFHYHQPGVPCDCQQGTQTQTNNGYLPPV